MHLLQSDRKTFLHWLHISDPKDLHLVLYLLHMHTCIYSKCNYALLCIIMPLLCQSIMALMADLDQQQQKSISILDLIMTNDTVNH